MIVGDGPGESVEDRIPLVMLGRKGGHVRFAVAIEPIREGAEPKISSVLLEVKDNKTIVNVRRADEEDMISVASDNELTVTSGGKTVLSKEP